MDGEESHGWGRIPWATVHGVAKTERLSVSLFSYPYMTVGKIIALTTWTFVGKVLSLLFNYAI